MIHAWYLCYIASIFNFVFFPHDNIIIQKIKHRKSTVWVHSGWSRWKLVGGAVRSVSLSTIVTQGACCVRFVRKNPSARVRAVNRLSVVQPSYKHVWCYVALDRFIWEFISHESSGEIYNACYGFVILYTVPRQANSDFVYISAIIYTRGTHHTQNKHITGNLLGT